MVIKNKNLESGSSQRSPLQALFFCVYLAPWLDDRTVCLAHSVAGVVGAGSSFLWTACMAYYVHFSVVHPSQALGHADGGVRGRGGGQEEWAKLGKGKSSPKFQTGNTKMCIECLAWRK